MKIPPLTTLRVEDFPSEQRKWLPRLFTPLNQFLTNASSAINGRIEFGSNIPSQDQALNFTNDGTAQRFRWNSTFVPAILQVGQAYENGFAFAAIATWSFDASTSTITVSFTKTNSTPLTVGAAYKIFVRVVP